MDAATLKPGATARGAQDESAAAARLPQVERGRTVSIFWDLGGQAALRALWGKYYDEAHGLLYVVDSEDVERLPESRRVLHEVVRDAALR